MMYNQVMATAIALDRHRIPEFCRHNGIRRLSLFGSVLREDLPPLVAGIEAVLEQFDAQPGK